jgi:hypothetical protein
MESAIIFSIFTNNESANRGVQCRGRQWLWPVTIRLHHRHRERHLLGPLFIFSLVAFHRPFLLRSIVSFPVSEVKNRSNLRIVSN